MENLSILTYFHLSYSSHTYVKPLIYDSMDSLLLLYTLYYNSVPLKFF
jgi:hypothetical protein